MDQSARFYKDNWWMYLLSGLVTLMFGFVAVVNPAQTFLSLAFFFGLFLILNGVIDMITAITSAGKRQLWLVMLLFSIVQTIFGVYILQRPGLSIATFVTFASLALLVKGVSHLLEVFDSKYDAVFRVWQAIVGAASILASVAVWRYPVKGTLAFIWVLGVYAIITGPLMIAFALEAKKGFKVSK